VVRRSGSTGTVREPVLGKGPTDPLPRMLSFVYLFLLPLDSAHQSLEMSLGFLPVTGNRPAHELAVIIAGFEQDISIMKLQALVLAGDLVFHDRAARYPPFPQLGLLPVGELGDLAGVALDKLGPAHEAQPVGEVRPRLDREEEVGVEIGVCGLL